MLCEVWKEPSVRLVPKIRRKKGTWFKSLDIADFVKCIVECIELYGAKRSIVGGLKKYLRIFWCRRGFMLLSGRIKYINILGYSGVEGVSCSLVGGLNKYLRIFWCRRGFHAP
jgi:hypothetical protein